MLCLSLVYSYMYMYVYALIVCTLLLEGNKGIYLSSYLNVNQKRLCKQFAKGLLISPSSEAVGRIFLI